MTDPTHFWAKTHLNLPGISVRDHCLNVGAVAQLLARTMPEAHRAFVTWLAACHDIGKISPGFQKQCHAWLTEFGLEAQTKLQAWQAAEPDHSKTSQQTLQDLLAEPRWAAISGMHHGSLHGRKLPELPPTHELWEDHRQGLARELATLLGEPGTPPSFSDPLGFQVAGLITVADWIGSSETWFSPQRGPAIGLPAATASTTQALSDIGLGQALPPLPERSFEQLFGFPPNDLQQQALATITQPGVFVIEAPMGMGKTEAALAASYQLLRAGHARGIYFALPTQATSNRIHLRVAKFLHQLDQSLPRLIHSGSWLLDESLRYPQFSDHQPAGQHRTAQDWFASAKRSLLAPFGVGTLDQALMAVIAVRHFFVRHYALAGKVVIIDEAHAYDHFTGTHLDSLVRLLADLQCTVIILSATLTQARREALFPRPNPGHRPPGAPRAATPVQTAVAPAADHRFPLISGIVAGQAIAPVPVDPPPPTPEIRLSFAPEETLIHRALEAANHGACVLWICNTVDRAQATLDLLHRAAGQRPTTDGKHPIALLHSRFTFADREALETRWITALGKDRSTRPPGCILISTQICEMSLDLDADLMVSELAPTDMLFQRLGRLWRHHGKEPAIDTARPLPQPELCLIAELLTLEQFNTASATDIVTALGKKARVYAPYILLRTLEQWHAQQSIHLPADIRPWLEATYLDQAEAHRPGWAELKQAMRDKKAQHTSQALTAQRVWSLPELKDDEGIGTRLDECPTLQLIIATHHDATHLHLRDGSAVPLQHHRFDHTTAKALHKNSVKAPSYFFTPGHRLTHLPSAVASMAKQHLRGDFEIALLHDGTLTAASIEPALTLTYAPEQGLARQSSSLTPAPWVNDFEDLATD